jgi:hypothetical protein
MGFAVVAFFTTVIFMVVSSAGANVSQQIVVYRLANEPSSMMIGQAIMGFAVVAFFTTVIFMSVS